MIAKVNGMKKRRGYVKVVKKNTWIPYFHKVVFDNEENPHAPNVNAFS